MTLMWHDGGCYDTYLVCSLGASEALDNALPDEIPARLPILVSLLRTDKDRIKGPKQTKG
jgi:hypothetical protein